MDGLSSRGDSRLGRLALGQGPFLEREFDRLEIGFSLAIFTRWIVDGKLDIAGYSIRIVGFGGHPRPVASRRVVQRFNAWTLGDLWVRVRGHVALAHFRIIASIVVPTDRPIPQCLVAGCEQVVVEGVSPADGVAASDVRRTEMRTTTPSSYTLVRSTHQARLHPDPPSTRWFVSHRVKSAPRERGYLESISTDNGSNRAWCQQFTTRWVSRDQWQLHAHDAPSVGRLVDGHVSTELRRDPVNQPEPDPATVLQR